MNYANGRTFEYFIVKQLKDEGYNTIRSAGSHGLFDVIGFDNILFRGIQAKVSKTGVKIESYVSEMNTIADIDVPTNFVKEFWIKSDKKQRVLIL